MKLGLFKLRPFRLFLERPPQPPWASLERIRAAVDDVPPWRSYKSGPSR